MQIVALTTFCVMSHCDLDIWRTNLKIHRVNARGTAYKQAMFRRNSLKTNRENGIQVIWNCWIGIFYFVSLWPWPLTCATQLFYMSLSIHTLNLRPIGRKTPEKSCNASMTDFQRLSPCDLDLCPMALQMHRCTVFANAYILAKFHPDRMKYDREIATSGFSILCPCDLYLWPSHPKKYTALLQVIIYNLATFEKDWMINSVTHVAVEKKNKMKIKDRTKTERSADYVRQTLIIRKYKTKTERSSNVRGQTLIIREKGRDLIQSYDKSPYTNRNVKSAKWQHKQRHKKFD